MAKKTVEVTIAGETIKLKTTEDEMAYVEELSKQLDIMINDKLVKGTNKLKATIMIALDLMNENRKMKLLIEDMHE